MGIYKKKPVQIQAHQWFRNGDHPEDHVKTAELGTKEGDVVRYYRHPRLDGKLVCQYCGGQMHFHGWIDTLEGGHIVCPGDFIITGVSGERYPCKPDIFHKTYEEV